MILSRIVLFPALGLTVVLGGCGGGEVASPGTVATPAPVVTPTPVTPTPVVTPPPVVTPTPVPTPTVTPADLIASPRPAQRSANDTAEFRTNYSSVELIGLLSAADAGLTGKGLTVGLIDGGFYTAASDLAGRQSSLSRDFGSLLTKNPDGTYAAVARNDVAATPSSTHGSIVAELLAGVRNGSGGIGVAPDASIAYLRVDDEKLLEPNADGTINSTLSSSNIAAAVNYAAAAKIPVLSLSLGITGGTSASLSNAIDRFAVSGGLFVIAAGNNGGANPESIQLLTTTNRTSWISVGGVATTGATFALDPSSAAAGTLADRYIVAAFENIAADPQGTGFYRFDGTSGAVPQVAAAAALVLQKWPQLTGKQAGDVLLATARDIGAAGTDPIFGHGLLDLKAALSPVDPVLVTASGVAVPITAATVSLPSAFGTGKITRLLARTVILDRFGRDFTVDAGGLVARTTNIGAVAGLTRTMRRNTTGTSAFTVTSEIALASGPVHEGEPSASLASTAIEVRTGAGVVAFTQGYAPWSGSSVAGLGAPVNALAAYAGSATTGIRTVMPFGRGVLSVEAGTGDAASTRTFAGTQIGSARVGAAGLGWSDGRWSFGGGVVTESGSLFGNRSGGTLQSGSGADTGFAEARYARFVGGWSIAGYGSFGVTAVRSLATTLLSAPSTIVTSRFGIEAAHEFGPGRVTFGIAQPLNVERGSAMLTHAVGYDLDARALTFRSDPVDLRGDRQFLAQAGIDLGRIRVGVVQGMLHQETGVISTMGWRF